MSSKKKNIYTYLGKVILITLLIVLFIRTFFVESYTISSSQMQTSLLEGDQVLIDKTSYGIRLPITILTIPFTFDKIFGVRSYLTSIEAPYKRILEKKIERNDIVLFNNPMDIGKPLDKRDLIVSRCIAMPGDTISVEKGLLSLNGINHIAPPDLMNEYSMHILALKDIQAIMEEHNIPIRSLKHRADTISILLNKLEAFIINENIEDSTVFICCKTDTTQNYHLIVPSKGKVISVNSQNINMYKQLILQEQEGNARIINDKLYIGGKEQTTYTFQDDYYWMLSDNTNDALDSRILGFIPFKNIIGKVRFIWYSTHNGNLRKERCLTSVN